VTAVQNPTEKDTARPVFDTTFSGEKGILMSPQESHASSDLPSTPNSRAQQNSITSPLFTPGEAEEDPLASVEVNMNRATAKPMSDKAKGKRRMSSGTMGGEGSEELHQIALQGIGPNGYVPTAEWVASWQKG
jgi:hypothetical protein